MSAGLFDALILTKRTPMEPFIIFTPQHSWLVNTSFSDTKLQLKKTYQDALGSGYLICGQKAHFYIVQHMPHVKRNPRNP